MRDWFAQILGFYIYIYIYILIRNMGLINWREKRKRERMGDTWKWHKGPRILKRRERFGFPVGGNWINRRKDKKARPISSIKPTVIIITTSLFSFPLSVSRILLMTYMSCLSFKVFLPRSKSSSFQPPNRGIRDLNSKQSKATHFLQQCQIPNTRSPKPVCLGS